MNRRLKSVDFIRGIAILAMIQVHLWGQFVSKPWSGVPLHDYLVQPVGGFAAPLFTMIAGVAAYLAIEAKYTRDGRVTGTYYRQLLKRGSVLFVLSTLINLITSRVLNVLDISLLNWSIFQLIGVCIVLAPLFFGLPLPGKALWLTIMLLLVNIPGIEKSILSPMFQGFAPFFPWSFLFFAGMVIGSILVWIHQKNDLHRPLIVVGAGIALLLLASLVLHRWMPYSRPQTARFELTNTAVYLGAFLVLTALFYLLLDRKSYRNGVTTSFENFGRLSLTIYYLQLFLIVVTGIMLAAVLGDPPRFDPVFFLPTLLILLLLFHLIVNVVWVKIDYRFSLEWFLAALVKGRSSVTTSRIEQNSPALAENES
jgi:uncharacterized membrane protein